MVGRVRGRAAFLAFRRSRQRVRRGPITITFVPSASDDRARVAYAIGRKVGGAVVRNRLRRRLRAVVAQLGPELPPGACLVSATPEAALLSFGELQAIMSEAVQALAAQGTRA
jgi:ribonuclease P protein component